ncbi:hypothetical protein CMV_002430 [Castanea mollissima]|uniref:Uncharacterized protein n=1 Tax=Castanea mollissima TaxID=60419 RepID=A0A8J4S1Q7_9ROSI|nr:hypothetical protein CMV_002430 [Castanea mollissima]
MSRQLSLSLGNPNPQSQKDTDLALQRRQRLDLPTFLSSGKVPYLLICMKDSYILTLFIQWGLGITGDVIIRHPIAA